jgi:hypothetical protein
VSRIAGLLAVAALGLVLYAGFNRSLSVRLDGLGLSPARRQAVDRERPKLAAAEGGEPRVDAAIDLAFVDGYRWVLGIAAGMGVVSAGFGWWLIGAKGAARKD